MDIILINYIYSFISKQISISGRKQNSRYFSFSRHSKYSICASGNETGHKNSKNSPIKNLFNSGAIKTWLHYFPLTNQNLITADKSRLSCAGACWIWTELRLPVFFMLTFLAHELHSPYKMLTFKVQSECQLLWDLIYLAWM